jgi:hypothetical protein
MSDEKVIFCVAWYGECVDERVDVVRYDSMLANVAIVMFLATTIIL